MAILNLQSDPPTLQHIDFIFEKTACCRCLRVGSQDGFEDGFNQQDWFVKNDDGSLTWDTIATQGLNWSNKSATVQCYSYNPREGQKDGLISNQLVIPNTTDAVWLIFDVAYQKWSNSAISSDTLTILVSTDCGTTFENEVYQKGGEELESTDIRVPNFIPELEMDWRRDSVNLTQFTGEDILIQFETKNGKGNDLYIDNVKVFVGDQEPAAWSQQDHQAGRGVQGCGAHGQACGAHESHGG